MSSLPPDTLAEAQRKVDMAVAEICVKAKRCSDRVLQGMIDDIEAAEALPPVSSDTERESMLRELSTMYNDALRKALREIMDQRMETKKELLWERQPGESLTQYKTRIATMLKNETE